MQLMIFLDKTNISNKGFFKYLKTHRGLTQIVLTRKRIVTSKTFKRILDTGATKMIIDIDPDFVAEQLGGYSLQLIDKINFKEFFLIPEIGTEFREENGKIIFWKDENRMTFEQDRILKIVDMNSGKSVWERERNGRNEN